MKKASEATVVDKAECPVGSRPPRKEERQSPVVRDRVLVMDDEELVRDIAGEMLKHCGFECEFAVDGAQAIEMYKKARVSGHPFTLLIMDLTIPGGMGGREAIKRLLEIDPHLTAIASSGYANDPAIEHYSAYGFKGVMVKPYRMEELQKALKDALRGTSA